MSWLEWAGLAGLAFVAYRTVVCFHDRYPVAAMHIMMALSDRRRRKREQKP